MLSRGGKPTARWTRTRPGITAPLRGERRTGRPARPADGVVFTARPKPARATCAFPSGEGSRRCRGGGRFGGGRAGAGAARRGGGDRAPARPDTHRVSSRTTRTPLDADGRPAQKILLSGPPGVGKTTLAHVAARHAGYRVVEVNASDDRGAESLKTRVTDATQMRSVLTAGGNAQRPNCVIIDEIDGVFRAPPRPRRDPRAAADVNGARGPSRWRRRRARRTGRRAGFELLSDAAEDGTMRVTNAMLAGALEGSDPVSGRIQTVRPLMWPIIAICNDPYAPAAPSARDGYVQGGAPASARPTGAGEVCGRRHARGHQSGARRSARRGRARVSTRCRCSTRRERVDSGGCRERLDIRRDA